MRAADGVRWRPRRRASRSWLLVLPIKGGPHAKSRLRGDPRLAEAVALDTLAAVLACPRVAEVLAVTADAATTRECERLGAVAVGESVPGAGLNAAIADGVRAATARRRRLRSRGRSRAVAVLLADLPALRPGDLAEALDAVARATPRASAFVADAEGTGTVLLASPVGRLPAPAFGAGSADAHERLGAVRLDLDLPRLRRDVDVRAELDAALALGAGPRTRAALGLPGLPGATGVTSATGVTALPGVAGMVADGAGA